MCLVLKHMESCTSLELIRQFRPDKFVCMNELMTTVLPHLPPSFYHHLPISYHFHSSSSLVWVVVQGASKIADSDALAHINTTPYSLENIIVQPFIEGIEYTVSAIVTRDGTVHSIVPKRIIKKDGVTKLAVTESVPAITL